MTADDHRDWRLSLGAYALGDLPPDERAAMAAHIEGCPECRTELRELEGVAALLAIFVMPIGGESSPAQKVEFASVPNGISIKATLEPHAFGTEIQMYVKGMPSGTLCRVFLRDAAGRTYSAGSFRYRWEEGSEAHLSSGLDLSQAAEIGLHAGGRTFVAPVSQATALVSGAEIDPA